MTITETMNEASAQLLASIRLGFHTEPVGSARHNEFLTWTVIYNEAADAWAEYIKTL